MRRYVPESDDDALEFEQDGTAWRFSGAMFSVIKNPLEKALERVRELEADPHARSPLGQSPAWNYAYGQTFLTIHGLLLKALRPHDPDTRLPHEPLQLERLVRRLVAEAEERGWVEPTVSPPSHGREAREDPDMPG